MENFVEKTTNQIPPNTGNKENKSLIDSAIIIDKTQNLKEIQDFV